MFKTKVFIPGNQEKTMEERIDIWLGEHPDCKIIYYNNYHDRVYGEILITIKIPNK